MPRIHRGRYRDHVPRTHVSANGRINTMLRSRSCSLHSISTPISGAPEQLSREFVLGKPKPGWKMRAKRRSDKTSNTTHTYSPIRACNYAGLCMTLYCNPTCSNRINRMTWIAWRYVTARKKRLAMKKSAAKALRNWFRPADIERNGLRC